MQPEVPSYSTLYQLPSFSVMATAAFWLMVIRMEYPVPGPLRIRTPVPLMTPSAATPVVEEAGSPAVSSLAGSSGVSSAAAACRAAFAVEPACFRSLLLAAASSAVSISSSAVMAAALTSAEKRAA